MRADMMPDELAKDHADEIAPTPTYEERRAGYYSALAYAYTLEADADCAHSKAELLDPHSSDEERFKASAHWVRSAERRREVAEYWAARARGENPTFPDSSAPSVNGPINAEAQPQ